MTEGERIVQEWGDTPASSDNLPDLARRIDAALAEQADTKRQTQLCFEQTVAKLVEREGHGRGAAGGMALTTVCDAYEPPSGQICVGPGSATWNAPPAEVQEARELLDSTADAAVRCIERAKAEGAEEMRERCERTVALEVEPSDPRERAAYERYRAYLVAAIRALPARRG